MVSNFNVLDFYDVAYFLADSDFEKEEAKIRTAIGRIYYTVFLILNEKAKLYGFKEDNYLGAGGSHKKLLAFFQKPKNSVIEKGQGKIFWVIAKDFGKLQTLRTNSDYKKDEITKQDLDMAKGLFKSLRIKVQNSEWNF